MPGYSLNKLLAHLKLWYALFCHPVRDPSPSVERHIADRWRGSFMMAKIPSLSLRNDSVNSVLKSSVYILIGLFLLMTHKSVAQQQQDSVSSTRVKKEKAIYDGFTPSAVRIGVSVSDLVKTISDPEATYYSFQADVPIRQYMLVVDYGRAKLDLLNNQTGQPDKNFSYSSQGSFFRAGIEANLLKDKKKNNNDASGNVIFFGLKYARSQLKDQVSFQPSGNDDNGNTNNIYNISKITERNDRYSSWWIEMNAGVKVSVFENVYLGYTLRYKFLRQANSQSPLVPYKIPGFGNGDSQSAFGFDYYIYYRIPFRK